MAKGMNLNIQVRGEIEAAEDVEKIGERALHPEPAFAEITHFLLEVEQKHWKRFKHGRMVLTGDLKASLTEGEPGQESIPTGAIREIYPERMRFGSSIYYSVFHQHAGGGVKGKVLIFRPADKKQAKEIIADYLVGEKL